MAVDILKHDIQDTQYTQPTRESEVSSETKGLGCSAAGRNVGTTERLASLAGGAALVLAGRQKGNLSGLLLTAAGAGFLYRGATGRCYCYQKLGICTATKNENTAIPAHQGVKVESEILINRPASELYRFWRDLSNLPSVFEHLESVQEDSQDHSRWLAKGPLNQSLEWEAEILTDRPNQVIAWRSLAGSQVDTAGSVRFDETSNGRGTHVAISLKYNPPGGQFADYVASWFGSDLQAYIDEDLRRFKCSMEAGEVHTSAGE